jgi:hypothetical protein
MDRRSTWNLTINTTGGCRANPRIRAEKEKRDQLLGRNLWRGDGEFQGWNNVRDGERRWNHAACSWVATTRSISHHQIPLINGSYRRSSLWPSDEMNPGYQFLHTTLIRDSGSKWILDSESKAAAFSFRIPHVFSIIYSLGQSGPLKGDSA